MQTIFGKTNFVALAILSVIAIVGLSACGVRQHKQATEECPIPGSKFCLTIHGPGTQKYHPLTAIQLNKFDNALRPLLSNQYNIEYLSSSPSATPQPHYTPHPHLQESRASIQTDKVTKSGVADSSAGGVSVANDPNVTYRVSSNEPQDIKNVLAAFQ
jgi:hypothetical protein